MMLPTLQQCCGRRVSWVKYNLATGLQESLTGTIISAGAAKNIGGLEYAIVQDTTGREWITLASCIKEIM